MGSKEIKNKHLTTDNAEWQWARNARGGLEHNAGTMRWGERCGMRRGRQEARVPLFNNVVGGGRMYWGACAATVGRSFGRQSFWDIEWFIRSEPHEKLIDNLTKKWFDPVDMQDLWATWREVVLVGRYIARESWSDALSSLQVFY
jgi:hypothetical protein